MSSTSPAVDTGRSARTAVQRVALVVGVVFLLVGIAGFVPGLTSDLGALGFAGMGSGAMLLGVFQVSVPHDVVHLLFGIVGLVLSRTAAAARNHLIWGGVIYAVLRVYGLATGSTAANFVPLNTADDRLHFGLALGTIVLGIPVGAASRRARGESAVAPGAARPARHD